MSFFDYNANKVWFTNKEIFVELDDGRQASLPLKQFPLLDNATLKQRKNFELIGTGYAIHWLDIDEDLSVAGFFENKTVKEYKRDRQKIKK